MSSNCILVWPNLLDTWAKQFEVGPGHFLNRTLGATEIAMKLWSVSVRAVPSATSYLELWTVLLGFQKLEPERRNHEFQTAWVFSCLRRKSEGSEAPAAKRTANAYQLFQKQRRPAEKTRGLSLLKSADIMLPICQCFQHMLVFG